MKITITNKLIITKAPDELRIKICMAFTMENPAWIENDRMCRSNRKTPRHLTFYQQTPDGFTVPRGALGLVCCFCKESNISYQIIDKTRTLPKVDFIFAGTLKGYQKEAVNDVLSHDFNVLQAPTGSGKTVMAMSIIAERRQPALIIVHSKELLNQWIARVETFLNIPGAEIGKIGGGYKLQIGEKVTIALYQTLCRVAPDVKDLFGIVVVDECHKAPSRTFTEAVTPFDCSYMLGLSATPYRRDGLTKLIGWHLGRPVEVDPSDLTENDIILDVEVVTRETAFTTDFDPSGEYPQMLSELTEDEDRNGLIVGDVIKEAGNGGGTCLVLSDRKGHIDTLGEMLRQNGVNPEILTGAVKTKDRDAIVGRLNAGEVRVLIATGQLIGEGFDYKGFSTLFLTTPIKFSGRLLQYLGRILRPAPGKDKATVYDYIDVNIGVLEYSAKAREKVWEGYR